MPIWYCFFFILQVISWKYMICNNNDGWKIWPWWNPDNLTSPAYIGGVIQKLSVYIMKENQGLLTPSSPLSPSHYHHHHSRAFIECATRCVREPQTKSSILCCCCTALAAEASADKSLRRKVIRTIQFTLSCKQRLSITVRTVSQRKDLILSLFA